LTAAAGLPPRVHSKDKYATLKNILYGYDASAGGVVVGPVLLNGAKNTNPTVPEVQEKGGTIRRVTKERGLLGRKKRQAVRIAPHPYMVPARDKVPERFPEIWYGSSLAADAA
jgi:hypothetical protein